MKVMEVEIKHHHFKNLDKIRPDLKDIMNDLKKSDAWKVKLTITINLISSKDIDEEHVMKS